MGNLQRARELYLKYLENDFTAEELDELLEYFNTAEQYQELNDMIQLELEAEDNECQSHPAVRALLSRLDQDLFAIINKQEEPAKTSRLKWYTIAVAASVAVIVAGLGIFFYGNNQDNLKKTDPIVRADIPPGKNKATLTLPNGRILDLSSTKTGIVLDADKLTYNDGSVLSHKNASRQAIENLTIITPRGGQYQVVMSDGTQVWLNAESSLKFPSGFGALNERRVELIGEAYFQVAKNKDKPFIVKSRDQEVRVLGTHFNVNAYTDESSIKTTLIEGSVMVCGKNKQVVLQPHQQAVFGNDIQVKEVDVDNETAWKNGDFVFDSDDLESIMRKISRWYNVEVVYKEKPDKKMHFGGFVSRAKNISAVLKIMQSTGQVSFDVQGRRITVIQN